MNSIVRKSPSTTSISAFLACVLVSAISPAVAQARPSAEAEAVARVESGESLKLVSIRLYGTTRKWLELAKLNGLKPPYVVWKGQRLRVLPGVPILPRSVGDAKVLEMWRQRTGAGIRSSTAPAAVERFEEAKSAWLGAVPAPQARVDGPSDEELSADLEFERGKALFDQGDHAAALRHFAKSILIDRVSPQAWFYAIRALKVLNRGKERRAIIADFLSDHPQFSGLPMFNGVDE